MAGESSTIDVTDPLYLNLSEGAQTLKLTTTLTGTENYASWRRQMELALATKRKLGYVTGSVPKPSSDEKKIEAWGVSNSLVISWIFQNVHERIKLIIMYTETAKEIWDILQRRYMVDNGARKFKLNKETYEITQNNRTVDEYFTQMQVIWDELENLNNYPPLTQITEEMKTYLKVVEKQAEEKRLFQFLNGLDKEYGPLRSNILLMSPLPSVDTAVSLMLQEESQKYNFHGVKTHEVAAFMSKGEQEEEKCKHCGRRNHRSEECWEVTGYPPGHPKNRKPNTFVSRGGSFNRYQRGGQVSQNNYRPNNTRFVKKNASNVRAENTDLATAIEAATHQLESLLKRVPSNTTNHSRPRIDSDEEELECNFAGLY